jgi:hypothetical protein
VSKTGRSIPAITAATAATDDPTHPEEAGGIGECSTSLWDFAEKEPNHEARAAAKSPARRHLPFRLPATAIGAEPFPPSPVTTRTSRHA